jgi:uncharacterized metal-binding protein
MSSREKPVVFACAGCSFEGRLAYDLAQELDRRGIAEMSYLAGLACEKKPFLKKIQRREVWIIDGCPIGCALGVLDRLRRTAVHIRLHDLGYRKTAPPPEGVARDSRENNDTSSPKKVRFAFSAPLRAATRRHQRWTQGISRRHFSRRSFAAA